MQKYIILTALLLGFFVNILALPDWPDFFKDWTDFYGTEIYEYRIHRMNRLNETWGHTYNPKHTMLTVDDYKKIYEYFMNAKYHDLKLAGFFLGITIVSIIAIKKVYALYMHKKEQITMLKKVGYFSGIGMLAITNFYAVFAFFSLIIQAAIKSKAQLLAGKDINKLVNA